MKINRIWAMPNKWTFTIKPIKELLSRYTDKGFWCDPFAGENSMAQIQNDLSGKVEFNMDAIEFLKTRKDSEFDGVLLDPPYSLRQVSEHYKKAGIKITGWHTSAGHNAAIKNEIARITKPGGIVISFGWNNMGLGLNRGFEQLEILLVPHGGSKNDTIVTVERKHSYNLKSKNHSQQIKSVIADKEVTSNCNRSGNEEVDLNQYRSSPDRNKTADTLRGSQNLNKESQDE